MSLLWNPKSPKQEGGGIEENLLKKKQIQKCKMNQKTPEEIEQILVLSKSLKPESFPANFVAK